MVAEHISADQIARIYTTVILAGLGIWQLAAPGCFWGMSMYFRGTRAALDEPDRERLARVLAARRRAEGETDRHSRFVGTLTILIAPLALIPWVPYVMPYALCCVAMAVSTLLSYLNFRRATERRVAPLVRRSPWSALPPLGVAATAVCIAGVLAFAVNPSLRLGAAIVIVAALIQLAIAWRVAVAPALLAGDDPQLEYAVDEHVRFCRTMNLVSLACAPLTVFVSLAWASPATSGPLENVVPSAVAIAFVVVMLLSLDPMRKRIRIA